MIVVKHTLSRTSSNFHDNYFEVTGVPLNNYNTIVISEALNDKLSKYGDEAFSPKPDGSSYIITVRGLTSKTIFTDAMALQAYILEKITSCSAKLKERND
jgi:hypothetical protein